MSRVCWREAKAHAEREAKEYEVQAWLVVAFALISVVSFFFY